MRTGEELFAEFQLALALPDYFGRNWNALEDCLGDLAWWPAKGYVLLFNDTSELLIAEPPQEMSMLLRILRSVASIWAEPEAEPDGTQRPPIPFHAVFQVAQGAAAATIARVHALGAAAQFGVVR